MKEDSKPVSVNNTWVSERDGLAMAAKPLFSILSALGVYYGEATEERNTPAKSWRRKAYCLLCNCFYWSGLIRFFFCFMKVSSVQGHVLLNATFGLYFLSMTLAISAFTLTSSTALPVFVSNLRKLHSEHGVPAYVQNGRRQVKILMTSLLTFLILVSVSSSWSLLLTDSAKSGRHCANQPFTISNPTTYYILAGLHTVITVLTMLTYVSIFCLFLIVCYILNKELSIVNQKAKKTVLLTLGDEMSRVVENVRLRYEEVVNLVKTANQLFSAFVFLQFALLIPTFCVNVFALVTETQGLFIRMISAFQVTIHTDVVSAITLLGIIINSKAHRLVNTVLQVDLRSLPETTVKSLMAFLHRLTGTSVGISAGGMFLVDKSTLLTIGGALVTYTVVVFQFQPPESTPDRDSLLNETMAEIQSRFEQKVDEFCNNLTVPDLCTK